MPTLSADIGRMDILLHRGSDESICVEWKIDHRDGTSPQPVDLRTWTAEFEMICRDESVYSQSCLCTSNGCAICDIPYSAFTSSTWDTRLDGEWRTIVRGNGGQVRILGHGYYRIV